MRLCSLILIVASLILYNEALHVSTTPAPDPDHGLDLQDSDEVSSEEITSEEEKKEISLEEHRQNIIKLVESDDIRNYLRHLTERPHIAGTEAEHETAQWVYDTWVSQGLSHVNFIPYETLLSYPSETYPNLVRHVSKDDEVLWTSQPKQKPLYAPEESSDEVPFTFNGYSPPGNVTAEIIYVNYGRESDFQYLEEHNISVEGRLVIARYGKIFRGNIVDFAERRGAVGAILYSDPSDYAPFGQDPEFTYPNTIMMPDSAAPAGTVYLSDGDPLTPFYPSVESAYRIPEEEASIPKIPVQPISYSDARTILCAMTGDEPPFGWAGGLNCTYAIGPGMKLEGSLINLEVHTHSEKATIYNVVGMIEGEIEPDRYVVVGNHRDAWVFGAVDPSSGTAAMLGISQVLADYSNFNAWRPRRSILFCSWAAEEYGLIGSQEWVEQFGNQISDKVVAYLNVDMAIEGNYTLRAKSAPLLYDILWSTSKQINNPDPEEVEQGRLTVYDTWALRQPDESKPGFPKMRFIGSGSDYKGFQHNLGVPCLDIRYTYDDSVLGEPLYHTLYETFALVDELYDQGFHFHTAIAQLWADLTVTLSSEVILPFSLSEYSNFMQEAAIDIISNHNNTLFSHNVTMDYFTSALDRFDLEVETFKNITAQIDTNDLLAVRMVNDKLMAVERAFIDPRGLPNRPSYNHVVAAPSSTDSYSGTAFSGLTDALVAIESTTDEEEINKQWRIFDEHLAAVTHYINSAGKALSGELW